MMHEEPPLEVSKTSRRGPPQHGPKTSPPRSPPSATSSPPAATKPGPSTAPRAPSRAPSVPSSSPSSTPSPPSAYWSPSMREKTGSGDRRRRPHPTGVRPSAAGPYESRSWSIWPTVLALPALVGPSCASRTPVVTTKDNRAPRGESRSPVISPKSSCTSHHS